MSDADPLREADQIAGVAPPEFANRVVGHDAALAGIEAQLAAGRLPSAILIHGPLGIGKATLAFALARRILTTTGDEQPHRVAEQVTAGSHPNLFLLRRAPRDTGKGFYTVIRVDEVRALRERLHHTRGRAGHRVAIIDSIDDCNSSAANALLKTLEEPPADTVFLLLSHRPGQLLPTIRSRCHVVALRPLADADVGIVLREAGAAEDRIGDAVALAGGRPRRAFEAQQMGDGGAIKALRAWLADPASPPSSVHLALADTLGADRDAATARFARDMLFAWLAEEARQAAIAGPAARRRLASATELWDKAQALFDDADSLNLDFRQTLVGVFDAIRKHLHDPAESR